MENIVICLFGINRKSQVKNDIKERYTIFLSFFGKDEETTAFLTWGPFKTIKEAKSMIKFTYFRRLGRKEPIGYAIVDKSLGQVIGTIEFHSFNYKLNTAEIGYVLAKTILEQGRYDNVFKSSHGYWI